MSILVRAGKNILFKAIAEILSRFVYLFFFIYMARKLGAADFGIFSFAFSLAGIFAIIVDPGLNMLIIRDVSKSHSLVRQYSDNILTVKILLSIATFLLLLAYVKLMGYDSRTMSAVLMMGVFLILNGFLDFFVAISNAHERMDIEAVIRVANKLFVAVVGAIALFLGSALDGLIGWMVVGSSAAVLASLFLVNRVITEIGMLFERPLIKTMLVQAYPMALTILFYIIYFKIDVVMLSLFHVNNADIGYYSASVKLIELLYVIPSILVGGIFPILSSLYEKSSPEFIAMFSKLFKILLLIVIPIVVITAFYSYEIIEAIYGNGYEKSASALIIVIWTALFTFPNILLLNVLIVANKQKVNALFAFICVLVNILLNLILIPRNGFIGCSVATVVTDALFFVLSAYFSRNNFPEMRLFSYSKKPILSGVLLVVLLFVLEGLNIIYLLPIAIIFYLMFIFLTKTLTMAEVLQFKKALIRD